MYLWEVTDVCWAVIHGYIHFSGLPDAFWLFTGHLATIFDQICKLVEKLNLWWVENKKLKASKMFFIFFTSYIENSGFKIDKSHDMLIWTSRHSHQKWSSSIVFSEIYNQTWKTSILQYTHFYLTSKKPSATKHGKVLTYYEGLTSIKSQNHFNKCLVRSHNKLKTFLDYCNAYGHQNWQGDDLPWEAPTHKVKWSFNDVLLGDHMTN